MKTLLSLPAAITQTHARPDRTERYVQIPTNKIISMLEADGYDFVRAQVKASRSAAVNPLYARHQVVMRRAGKTDDHGLGIFPEIILDNSHDGSSSLRVMMGVYRFICSNGLIVGTTFSDEKVRHTGMEAADVLKRVSDLSKNTQPLFDKIEKWSRTPLSTPQSLEFARLASVARWGDAGRFDPEDVLRVRRAGDDAGDLWSVFNRTQENCVRGGLVGVSASGRNATSRPLSEIGQSTAYNAALWTLAEDFADALA